MSGKAAQATDETECMPAPMDELKTTATELRQPMGRLASWLDNVFRHPLFLAVIGFLLTGILGGSLTYWFNSQTQKHEIQNSTRNNALAAVGDLSEVVNERRERAALVISSIRRGAPEEEIDARKREYDEAYVRWNAKVLGDLLRIRAGLGLSYKSSDEKYIDSLTNFDSLISGNEANKSPAGQRGLLSLMDTCLTKAFDKYRLNSFKVSPEVSGIIVDCKFDRLYSQTISCFATIVESLYGAVDRIAGVSLIPISDEQVVDACRPPSSAEALISPKNH